MKKYIVFALVSALFAVAFSSCRKDEPLSKDSIITMDDYIQNDFDKWLEANFRPDTPPQHPQKGQDHP